MSSYTVNLTDKEKKELNERFEKLEYVTVQSDTQQRMKLILGKLEHTIIANTIKATETHYELFMGDTLVCVVLKDLVEMII